MDADNVNDIGSRLLAVLTPIADRRRADWTRFDLVISSHAEHWHIVAGVFGNDQYYLPDPDPAEIGVLGEIIVGWADLLRSDQVAGLDYFFLEINRARGQVFMSPVNRLGLPADLLEMIDRAPYPWGLDFVHHCADLVWQAQQNDGAVSDGSLIEVDEDGSGAGTVQISMSRLDPAGGATDHG